MGHDSPPQMPPSKSSPPSKRSKISPTYAKSSPAVVGAPHPSNHPRATIEEKLESMPMQRVSQMDLNHVNSAYTATAYAQPPYGTLFQHPSYNQPPGMHNLPTQMPPHPPPSSQPPPLMYGGAPPPGGPLPYGGPQNAPHYPGGGASGLSHPSYYQQHPPMPPAGRGGYYHGPP